MMLILPSLLSNSMEPFNFFHFSQHKCDYEFALTIFTAYFLPVLYKRFPEIIIPSVVDILLMEFPYILIDCKIIHVSYLRYRKPSELLT